MSVFPFITSHQDVSRSFLEELSHLASVLAFTIPICCVTEEFLTNPSVDVPVFTRILLKYNINRHSIGKPDSGEFGNMIAAEITVIIPITKRALSKNKILWKSLFKKG